MHYYSLHDLRLKVNFQHECKLLQKKSGTFPQGQSAMSRSSGTTRRRRRHGQPAACEVKRYAICGIENHGFRGVTNGNKKLASNAKRYPLCENRRIPFTRNPPVSCLLGRCPNPRRTKNFCSETMDKSIGCAILQIACGREAQRCSASFSRRSFASSCSLSNSRIRSILALAVSSSFISSRAFR